MSRLGRTSGLRHDQCRCQAVSKASYSQRSISQLGTLVVGDDTYVGTEHQQQSLALGIGQRRRTGDVELQFDSGVGPVSVLATRSATGRKPHDELIGIDETVGRNLKPLRHIPPSNCHLLLRRERTVAS